ncbi:MAG: hypothetical protein QNL82_01715 [Candidatus Thioglobus sp.]
MSGNSYQGRTFVIGLKDLDTKLRKEAMIDTVTRYLDTQEQGGIIDGAEREEVLTLWRRRAKEIGGTPKF